MLINLIELNKTIDFIKGLGIEVEFYPLLFNEYKRYGYDTFLDSVLIKDGKLLLNPDDKLRIDNILHEAGHIATVPIKYRPFLNYCLNFEQIIKNAVDYLYLTRDEVIEELMYSMDDLSAQGWSYFACVELGFDPHVVFRYSFEKDGGLYFAEEIEAGFNSSLGCLVTTSLYYNGMLEAKNSRKLKNWIKY